MAIFVYKMATLSTHTYIVNRKAFYNVRYLSEMTTLCTYVHTYVYVLSPKQYIFCNVSFFCQK
jgi:hypothetical protein